MKSLGFTLLELMISLIILSILLFLAVPSFTSQIQKSRTETAARTLADAIETARNKAVFLNQRTVLMAMSDWHNGWELFVDENNNGIKEPAEQVILKQDKLIDVKIRDNFRIPKQISFIGTGESKTPGMRNRGAFIAGTIQICNEPKTAGIKLVLNSIGRLRAEELKAEECADL